MTTILVVDDSPTIRNVVGTVLQARGYNTQAATDGQNALELLEQEKIDMVLLDFVMPLMNGYQFCRHLRADPRFEQLPVVLMSAKGDKIRGQFVQQTGAVDTITKPFDPRALVAVVESALRKPSIKPEVASALDEEPEIDLQALQQIAEPQQRAAGVRLAVAKNLAHLVAARVPLGRSIDPEHLEASFEQALELPRLTELLGLLKLLDSAAHSSDGVLEGDLGFISIAEVMQLLELQRQTGSLTISSGSQKITLYLSDGRIDLAKAENLSRGFRLGRFLIEDKVITREELQGCLNETDSKRLLGEALIEQKKATEDQIRQALRRQTSEIVYESVRWKSGRFMFRNAESCPEAALAQLALQPGGLLMEGFRRVDEWQLIEGSFKFDDVLKGDATAIERATSRQDLTPLEKRVLETVDGKRTVRQIVDHVDASTFEVCKILYQFLKSRLVRPKAS